VSQDQERPQWDQEKADRLVGKYVLVGITWLAADRQTVESQGEYHGRITAVDREKGITVVCEGSAAGQTMELPPVPAAFQEARPGSYRLSSTDEVIDNPDFTCAWTFTAPAHS
jgi:hypothetical protein